jgi:hypothetical protein
MARKHQHDSQGEPPIGNPLSCHCAIFSFPACAGISSPGLLANTTDALPSILVFLHNPVNTIAHSWRCISSSTACTRTVGAVAL